MSTPTVTVSPVRHTVTVAGGPTVSVSVPRVTVVTAGTQGPQGIQGPAGGTGAAGSDGQLQYNSGGVLAGTVGLTFAGGLLTGSGAALTSLAAGNLATGTVPTARLGSGTANATTFLRGDSTWAAVSSGVSDHGALTGLGDDDHAIYALLAPGASARNVVQAGAAGVVPMTFKGHAAQGSTHLFEVQSSTGALVLSLQPDRRLRLGPATTTGTMLRDDAPGFTIVNGNETLRAPLACGNFDCNGTFTVSSVVQGTKFRVGSGGPVIETDGTSVRVLNNAESAFYPLVAGDVTCRGHLKLSSSADVGFNRTAATVVGVTDGSTGGGILEFLQVAAGGTPTTNSARIYAKDVAGNAELFVKDEAGTETQISPHAQDAPAHFYDLADEFPFVTKETNHYTAKVRYINHSRQARAQQALYNGTRTLAQIQALPVDERRVVLVETFAEHNARLGLTGAAAPVKLTWATEQQKLQDAYDLARTAELAAHAAWLALPPAGRDPEPYVRPAADVRKPKPAWLAARGG